MLETLAVILVILWVLGLVSSYTMGGLIHLLLGYRYRGDPGARHSRPTCLGHYGRRIRAPGKDCLGSRAINDGRKSRELSR